MTDTSKEAKRLYMTMVFMPERGWFRVGPPYSKKDVAKSWLPFVKSAWFGAPVRVQSIAIRRQANGDVLPSVLKRLDVVFNLDIKDAADASTNNPLP